MAALQVNYPIGTFRPPEADVAEHVADVANQAIQSRRQTITSLRDLSERADALSKREGGAEITPSLMGVAGGAATAAAGIATIVTGGAALPVIGGLSLLGTALGVGGGGMSVLNIKRKVTADSNLETRVRDVLRSDAIAIERLENLLERVRNGYYGDQHLILRELHIVGQASTLSLAFGADKVIKAILACLTPLAFYLTTSKFVIGSLTAVITLATVEGSKEVAKEVAKEIADDVANKAVSEIAKGFSREMAKRSAAVAAKKAAQEVLEEGAEEVMREAARKAAQKAANKAVEKTMATAAKVTGGITTGFGVVSIVWEGNNIRKAVNKYSARESTMGKELRILADELENRMEGGLRQIF